MTARLLNMLAVLCAAWLACIPFHTNQPHVPPHKPPSNAKSMCSLQCETTVLQEAAAAAQQELSHRNQLLVETRAELDSARCTPRDQVAEERNRMQDRQQANHLLASKLARLETDWRWGPLPHGWLATGLARSKKILQAGGWVHGSLPASFNAYQCALFCAGLEMGSFAEPELHMTAGRS